MLSTSMGEQGRLSGVECAMQEGGVQNQHVCECRHVTCRQLPNVGRHSCDFPFCQFCGPGPASVSLKNTPLTPGRKASVVRGFIHCFWMRTSASTYSDTPSAAKTLKNFSRWRRKFMLRRGGALAAASQKQNHHKIV